MRGLVLFDLDGTLVDSAPGLAHSANVLRERRLLARLPYEALREHCGRGAAGLIWAALRLTPAAPCFEDVRREFLENYATVMTGMSTPFAGVQEMLADLARAGFAWGVVTNKAIELARPLCEAKGLAAGAACILSAQTFGAPKPAPDALLHAMTELGYSSRETLYVGDDARDALAARNAGLPFIAASWGYTASGAQIKDWGANACAGSPADICRLAKTLLAG